MKPRILLTLILLTSILNNHFATDKKDKLRADWKEISLFKPNKNIELYSPFLVPVTELTDVKINAGSDKAYSSENLEATITPEITDNLIYDWIVNDKSISELIVPFHGGSLKNYIGNTTLTKSGDVSYISNAEGRDGVYELKTNGYMQGSINTAPLRSSFSFGLWMKQVSEPTGSCSVFQIGNSETNKSAFIAIEHPNKIKVGFYNVHELYASDVNAQDGWHYVVTTYDGTYLRLYIDGEFKLKSTNSTSDLNITDAVVSIGSHYGNVGNHFNGYVDDLFVYNRELTSEQIKTMYNAHMSSGKYRNNIIVSEEIKPGDKWKVCVTPNDNSIDGTEICSDLITITDQDIAPVHINNGNSIAGNLYDLNVNVLNGNTTDSKLVYNWYVDKGSGYMPITDMNVPMDYGENGATKVINYAKNEELNVTGDLEYHSTGGFDGKGCYKFSGNDFISTNADLNTNFTYGAWVKTTETTPDHSEATSGQSGISGVKYVFWPHSTGGSGVAVGTNGIYVYEHATNFLPCVAKYKADIGTGWNHIMVTYKNSVPTIYLNGEPVRIKTTVTKSGVKAPMTIGCYTYGSFNGFIDDAVIYNRTLSDGQIKAMYNNYTSTNIYRNNIIVGQETNINEKWKVDVIQSEYDKIYNAFTSNEIVIGDPVINLIELNNNKTEINSRTGLEITKEVVTPDDVKLIYNWQVSKDGTNFNPVKIIDMPMDGGTLASGKVKDYIGGNHGTVNGATYQSDGGYDSKGAYMFNGTSDYIEIGDISGTESVSNITISAWVKTNKFEWGGVVDKRDNEGNNGWQLICGNGTMGNRFAFYIWTDDGYNSIGVFSNPGMETGKWYFLTVTYDGSYIKMYVNGEYHSHTAVTGNIVNSEAKVKIGSHHNTYFYDGFIDDVKIYNRTLTPYQVKNLCSGYNFNTQQFSEYSNNTIHHNETKEGDLWKVLVIPNDNSVDGLTKTSNQVTIVATPIMKSCNEFKAAGFTISGNYLIDPDGEGSIKPFETYCDMTSTDIVSGAVSSNMALQSCLHHLVLYPDNRNKDGIYLLDSDGNGIMEPFKTYCDMTTDGGGWTLFTNIVDGGFDYNASISAQLGTDKLNESFVGSKPSNSVARLLVEGNGASYFKFDLVQDVPTGSYSPSTDSEFKVFEKGFNTVLSQTNAQLNVSSYPLYFETSKTGYGGGSMIKVSGANSTVLDGDGINFFWVLNQQISGGYNCKNTLTIGNLLTPNNHCTNKNATKFWLLYRESGSEYYGAEKSCNAHKQNGRSEDGIYKIDPDDEGGIEPFEAYCDMTSTDFTTNSESASTSLESCMQHLIYYPDNYTKDGVYMLDPDGKGGIEPFKAFCDMTAEGGGWTLLMKNTKNGTDFSGNDWISNSTINGEALSLANSHTDNRSKFNAYNYVKGTELKMTIKNPAQTWYHDMLVSQTALNWFSAGQMLINGSLSASCNGAKLHLAQNYNASLMKFGKAKQAYGFNITTSGGDGTSSWIWGFGSNDEHYNKAGVKVALLSNGSFQWSLQNDCSECSGCYGDGATEYTDSYSHMWIRDDESTISVPSEKSCQHHYLKNRKIDGVYKIDPDGDGPIAAFEAYCDMTTDDGGWTLVANMNKNDVLITTGLAKASDKTQNVVTTGTSDIEFDIVREKSYEDFYYNFATAQKLSDGVDSKNPEGVTDAERLDLYLGKDAFNLGNDNCTTPEVSKLIGNGFYFSWSTYFNCGYKKGLYGTAGGGTGTNKWSTHVHPTGNYNGQSTLWIKNSKLKAPEISSFQTSSSRIEKGESVTLSWDVTDAVKIELISYNDGNFLEPSDVTGTTEKVVVPESDGTYVDYILRVTDDNGFISEKKLLIFFNKLEPYSLRFNRDLSNKLTITTGEQSSGNDFTFSVWVKLNRLDIVHGIFFSGYYNNSASNQDLSSIYISGGKMFFSDQISNKPEITIATIEPVITNDNLNEWHHLCYVMKNKVITVYFDGVEKATQFTRENQTELNSRQTTFGSNLKHYLGSNVDNGANLNYDGYMSDIHFINGSALEVSDFGEQRNGKWLPKQTSIVNYGTNGFFLNLSDQTNPGKDFSGNDNDWTPVNYDSRKDGDKYIDQMLDAPTRNFAVLDPNSIVKTTLSTGNLYFANKTNLTYSKSVRLTLNFQQNNKFYWESKIKGHASNCSGVAKYLGLHSSGQGYLYQITGKMYSGGYTGTVIDSWGTNSLVRAKLDLYNGINEYAVNGNSFKTAYDIEGIKEVEYFAYSNTSGSCTGGFWGYLNCGQGGQTGLKDYVWNREVKTWSEATEGEIPDARFAYKPPEGFRPLSENFFIPQIEFTANRYSAKKGSNITLNWDIDYVTGITASSNDPNNPFTGSLEKKGTLQITLPDAEGVYKYTITANNDVGDIVTKTVTIYISDSYKIGYSLRFNKNEESNLYRKPSETGNGKIWTYSFWVKRGDSGYIFPLTAHNTSPEINGSLTLQVNGGAIGFWDNSDNRRTFTPQVISDYDSWHHVVVIFNTTKSELQDRIEIYVDGTKHNHSSSVSGKEFPVYNKNYPIGGSVNNHYIGYTRGNPSYHYYSEGYIAEAYFIDGANLSVDNFGELKDGKWVPKQPDISNYGVNGFYLNLSDQTNPGKDFSGNGNDWTLVNYDSRKDGDKYIDQMLDAPTRNFAVLNPDDSEGNGTGVKLYSGNLEFSGSATVHEWRKWKATKSYNDNKYYSEIKITGLGTADLTGQRWGVESRLYVQSGGKYNGTVTDYGDSWSEQNILSVAVDGVNKKVWYSINSVWQISGNPVTGENPAFDDLTGDIYYQAGDFSATTSSWMSGINNFGQGGQTGLKDYVWDREAKTWREATEGEMPDARFAYKPPEGFRPLSENFFIPNVEFTSDRYRAQKGSTISLNWNIDNAAKATASSDDPNNPFTGSLEKKGTLQITLPDTEGEYKYTIMANNNVGDVVSKTVTVVTGENHEIDYSLRFNAGNNAVLKRIIDNDGNRHTWSFSCWFKPVKSSASQMLLTANQANKYDTEISVNTDLQLSVFSRSDTEAGGNVGQYISNLRMNDYSKWYHIVIVLDQLNPDSNEKLKMYIDGQRITSFVINGVTSSTTGYHFNRSGVNMNIGYYENKGGAPLGYFNSYLSEIYFVDGNIMEVTEFGETINNKWVPKQPNISDYGTNGFYLNFSDQTNPGKDFSGNGNDWTIEGTWTKDDDKYIDQMLDSPTRNFNVLDFNNKGKDVTKVQEGNLYASTTGRISGYKMMISTTQEVRPESSYYFEQDIISWKDTRYYTGFIGSQYNDQVPNYAGLSVSIPEKYFYSALDDRFFSSSGIYFDGTNNATVGSVISWLVDKGEVRVKRDNVFSKNGDAVFPKFNNNLYVVFGPQSGDQSNGKSDLQVTRYNFGQGGQAGLKDYKIDITTGVWTEVTDGSVPDVRFEYAPPTGLYPINDAFVSPDISSFTANPTVVGSGGTTDLEWSVTGSVKEELWLDGNKIANITGQSPYTITPPEEPGEYTYTLKTYSGAGLISTKEVKVTVTAAGVSVESVQINDNNSEYRSNQRLEAVHTGLNPTDGNLIYNWFVDRGSGNNTIADVIIPFDGNTVNDKSGNNNNGALHDDENDGYNSNGKYGVGYEFDGVNDYIEMPTIGNLFNSDFSYSIWVYIPSEARTEDVSFFNVRNFDDNGSGDHRAGHIVLQPDDNIRFECKGDGDNVLLEKTKNISITKDVYLHFVVSKRGNEFRFYYNGEEQPDMRITTSGSTAIDDNNISLGRLNSNTVTEYFKGRVDELMIFDRALSSGQIKSVYDNGMKYIVPSETRVTDKWQVKVIPSNGTNTGEEKQSQQVTITASRRRLIVVETQ